LTPLDRVPRMVVSTRLGVLLCGIQLFKNAGTGRYWRTS
jgi:hypothetical protein